MFIFNNQTPIDPLSLSTPVLAVDAETGVSPAIGGASINTVSNQTGDGVDAYSWVGSLRRGANVWGYEEPVWSTAYTRTASNPHKLALFTYLGSKNVKVARIGFCWESMQPTALGALDSTYLAAIKLDVDRCLAQGIYVNICPWQYNASVSDTDITYFGAAITDSNFSNFWSKVATAFSYDQRISFGLINEPHTNAEGFGAGKIGISLNNWFSFAQNAINAIRVAGATNYITVPGMGYASAGSWVANGSAAKFIALTDALSPKRLICELHNYGDDFTTSAGHNLGVNMQPAVDHARSNGYKIFIAELATSDNPAEDPVGATTLAKWSAFISFIGSNTDVFCAWCWFACDDNTVASWGEDFFHWSLTQTGSNNADSRWMNLIEGDLGETAIDSSGASQIIADASGSHPIWKTSDFKASSLHSFSFTQASSQRFKLSVPSTMNSGSSYFATFKYTSIDATASDPANCPLTLFGASSSQKYAAGFSAGKARYVSNIGGSSTPGYPITFTKNTVFSTVSSGLSITNYLYVPTAYNIAHTVPMPLLIWLHGSGGSSATEINNVVLGSGQNYIALTVGGFDGGSWNSNMALGMSYVLDALSDIKNKFNIDPSKVMIGGYSAGGDLAYRTIFHNSILFCGILAENTNPFRDTGESQATLLAAEKTRGWKFNIAHLLHLSDSTYPAAQTRTDLATCSSNDFPVTKIEKAGTHYDTDAGATGTVYDLKTFLLTYMSAGWVGPTSSSSVRYDAIISTLNDGKTHTICWTHSTSGTLKAYVDGVLNKSWAGVTYDTAATLSALGAGLANADTYNGSVAEAYAYNGVITDQDVRNLHSRSNRKWF